mmetsp:Transcript_24996/g.41816  ORF Transcript_24996/g.41816 Transcript_24996/m.41816 type:complete len:579 (+) Transcript_24996:10853-12589(+)
MVGSVRGDFPLGFDALPGPSVRSGVQFLGPMRATAVHDELLASSGDGEPFALLGRRPANAIIGPRGGAIHKERAALDGELAALIAALAQLLIEHGDLVAPDVRDLVVHFVEPIVAVDHPAGALAPLVLWVVGVLDADHKRVPAGAPLGVGGVPRGDEERHLHAEHALVPLEPGAERNRILGGRVREVAERHLVDGPSLARDAHLDVGLNCALRLKIRRHACDGVSVHKCALGDNRVLAMPEPDLDLPRIAELDPFDGEQGLAEDRTDERGAVAAGVGRPDDGRHVEGPQIRQPVVSPPAEEKQPAGLVIVRNGGVFARGWTRSFNLGLLPLHVSDIHDLHVVGVLEQPGLAEDAEHLVVGHALDGASVVVAQVEPINLRGKAAFFRPGHGLDVHVVDVALHLDVVLASEEDELSGKQGRAVVEARAGTFAVDLGLLPAHGGLASLGISEVGGDVLPSEIQKEHVRGQLAVATVPSVDPDAIADQRRAVMRARARPLALDDRLLPNPVLPIQDPHVVEALASVEPSEDEDPPVRHRCGCVACPRGGLLSRNDRAVPLHHFRITKVEGVTVVEGLRSAVF